MQGTYHTTSVVPDRTGNPGRYVLWGIVLLGTLLFYGISLWWGELNQDEGWYLYAGRMVAEGYLPYRDFAFTQGPLMAYVYAAAYPLIQWQGVLGGRLFTVFLAWGALGLAVSLVRMIAARNGQGRFWPMLLVVAFWGLNLYQVYYTTIPKTYALAAVCVLAGILLLERSLAAAIEESASCRLVLLQSFAGGMVLAFGAGVRLSAAFLLPAFWLPLAFHWLRTQRPRPLGTVLVGMLAGGTSGIILVFAPFYVLAADGMHFGLFSYHTGRDANSFFSAMAYKGGFLLRLMQAYWPLFAAMLLLPWESMIRAARRFPGQALVRPLHVPIGAGFVVVTVVHLLSVFPYDDYQVFVMPLVMISLALAVGHFLERWHVREGQQLRWTGGVIVLLFCFGLSSGLLQSWLIGPRDLIWWPLREQSSLAQLRDVGHLMREGDRRSAIAGKVITQDIYLAVESGYRVPSGMELGPFANFWDLSDPDAARFGVLNDTRAHNLVATTDAEWAAYSGYGFAISAPGIVPIPIAEREELLALVQERFILVDVFRHFGQASTDLHLYRRK